MTRQTRPRACTASATSSGFCEPIRYTRIITADSPAKLAEHVRGMLDEPVHPFAFAPGLG